MIIRSPNLLELKKDLLLVSRICVRRRTVARPVCVCWMKPSFDTHTLGVVCCWWSHAFPIQRGSMLHATGIFQKNHIYILFAYYCCRFTFMLHTHTVLCGVLFSLTFKHSFSPTGRGRWSNEPRGALPVLTFHDGLHTIISSILCYTRKKHVFSYEIHLYSIVLLTFYLN